MKKIDNNGSYSRGLDGTDYLPGCVGLNNIKCTDYVNVIIQALCRVPDLRDFFIFYENKKYTSDVFDFKTLLSKRFSELIRKIWNPRNFKGHVSPHELLQAISIRSDKNFRLDQQSDPLKLLIWSLILINLWVKLYFKKTRLINNLHTEILRIKHGESIISKCFRGEIEIMETG